MAAAGIEPVASRGPRRLAKPKAVRVKADESGRPLMIEQAGGRRGAGVVAGGGPMVDGRSVETPVLGGGDG